MTEAPRFFLIARAEENASREAQTEIELGQVRAHLPELYNNSLKLLEHPDIVTYQDSRQLRTYIGRISVTITELPGRVGYDPRITVGIGHLGQTLIVRKHDDRIDGWLEIEDDEKHLGYSRPLSLKETRGYLEVLAEVKQRLAPPSVASIS